MSETKHILTNDDVVGILRVSSTSEVANLEMYLSGVDETIKTETGHDWAQDDVIDPLARLAAASLFLCLYDGTDIPASYRYRIVQLHAKALELEGV